MSTGMTKYERLQEMMRLYQQRAFSDIEMARRLSTPEHRVDRTTVYRYRKELGDEYEFTQDAQKRWRIDRTRLISNVPLNIREALSLYLAGRRASQQTKMGQAPMANALEKLALAMKKPMTERLVQSAEKILMEQVHSDREKIFETIANAWVEGRRLRIKYQGLQGKRVYDDIINPYLIEPSPWSDAVYVIGPSQRLGRIVSYRMDRIQHAFMSGEVFSVSDDFDEDALLRHAWGVWTDEGEPQQVVLRFAPGPAAKRLQESKWHPLEEVASLEDGSVLWRAPIAQWKEMLPWIRGWGADVEVLEPEELRIYLEREIKRLMRLYELEQIKTQLSDDDYDDIRASQLFRR